MRWKYEDWEIKDGILFTSDWGPHSWTTHRYHHDPDRWLAAVDIRSGKELWRSKVEQMADFSMPVIGDGVVIVASSPSRRSSATDRNIFAFRATRTGK